jgi:3-hydroxybutyryl-CoA dehydratase
MKKGDTFQHEFQLDEFVYTNFIQTFHDKNPLHTNQAFARNKGFQDKVMHGNILGGFLSFFIGECLPTKEVIIHSQEIKYKRPVYLNQNLLFNAEIVGLFESVKSIEFSFVFSDITESVVFAKGKIQIGII